MVRRFVFRFMYLAGNQWLEDNFVLFMTQLIERGIRVVIVIKKLVVVKVFIVWSILIEYGVLIIAFVTRRMEVRIFVKI